MRRAVAGAIALHSAKTGFFSEAARNRR
jgi:hypothetical protein